MRREESEGDGRGKGKEQEGEKQSGNVGREERGRKNELKHESNVR